MKFQEIFFVFSRCFLLSLTFLLSVGTKPRPPKPLTALTVSLSLSLSLSLNTYSFSHSLIQFVRVFERNMSRVCIAHLRL